MVQNYISDSFYSFARPDMHSMLLIRSLFHIKMFQNDLNSLGGIFQIDRCQNCTVFCNLTRIVRMSSFSSDLSFNVWNPCTVLTSLSEWKYYELFEI